MPDNAFEALKTAFQHHVAWLQSQAAAYEQGKCQHIAPEGNHARDTSREIAEELQHQANNLEAVLAAYERLRRKNS